MEEWRRDGQRKVEMCASLQQKAQEAGKASLGAEDDPSKNNYIQ